MNVPKVFDWINKFISIKEKEIINIKNKDFFKELICCDFSVYCGETATLFSAFGMKELPSATFKLDYSCGCDGKLDVIVNSEKIISLMEGQSICSTVVDLTSIEVFCHGNFNGKCTGRIEIQLNQATCEENDIISVDCYLSDCKGNKVNPQNGIHCEEIPQAEGRKTVKVKHSSGKKFQLQKVHLIKSGYIVLLFKTKHGKTIKSCPIPFEEVETVFLCAPEGTIIDCEITDFECQAFIVRKSQFHEKECIKVIISIDICQSISSIADVKLVVAAKESNPRKEITYRTICPSPDLNEACL